MDAGFFHYLIDEAALVELFAGLSALVLAAIFLASLAVLSKGADWLIDGVVGLALRTGLPRIVIGATLVSLGTTLPEAFVSVMAAWMGNPNLALGNGVGSIIADTGLIFGLTCLLAVVPVNRFILDRTGWVQVGSATLLVVVGLASLAVSEQPYFQRWAGFLFLGLLVAYLYVTYRWARQGAELAGEGEQGAAADMATGRCLAMIGGGLLFVVLGARFTVSSASELAVRMGVPQDVVAATMVALGTSLPELMTAIAAVRKGHPEIMVGNVVGADVLNCLFVIGAAAAVKPLAIADNFFLFHFPAMLLILYSFRVFISMNRDGRFRKWQGGWLLGIYLAYLAVQYLCF